jgi:hypothetical protein
MCINNLKQLLSLMLLGGLLAGCSDEVGVESNPPDLPPIIEAEGTQIDIQETPLPIIEDFAAADTVEFFSTSYRALATPASNDIVDDDDNTITMVDPWPSLYYPTCCFFNTDPVTGAVIRTPPYADDMEFRLRVGDNKMGMSNSRFTIGQILSDLTSPAIPDRKRDTTDSPTGASLALGSWGELNLTEPYRVSFCLVDYGISGAGASNLEVWVDNNSGGRQTESIHSISSLLLRTAITGTGIAMVAGNRIVVDVPGDAYMVDNSGARVGPTLAVIQPLDGLFMPVGTFSSFLQLRVSSGGYAVISDLIIEYQEQDNAADLTTPCTQDTNFWVQQTPSEMRETLNLPGDEFTGLPLNVDATAGEAEFFAQLGGESDAGTTTGNYLAISNNEFDNFYKEVGSPTRIFVEAVDNAIRFGNALWTMGLREGAQDNCGGNPAGPCDTVNGDIDLSQPYRITAEILELPLVAGYRLQVQTDNATGTGSNSVHGAVSRIANLIAADGLEVGTLVINVPGEITMNGTQLTTMNGAALADPDFAVPALVGTDTSFIAFRCPSECGNAVETVAGSGIYSGGLVLGDVVVEYQP